MSANMSNHLYWFPITKLRPPSTQELIPRPWLIGKLVQLALAHRLTLISAPAGSGKTTLAADLTLQQENYTVRWLSLDDSDNNLHALLLAFTITLLPEPNQELMGSIQTGHLDGRQVANILVNWLDELVQQPLLLILDDLHLVTDKDCHGFLDYLIERIPGHVHIVATTRYDPPLSLPRMRARGELAELHLDELRFSVEEATEYLNRLLNLKLTDDLIAQLCQRTEGWVAGLRLLALSLEHVDNEKRAQYINDLAQNDRYVFELLAQEVLAQQDANIRQFLLETSILYELTPELCQQITGQSQATYTLHELHRRNLFLTALGDGTYRYHALFQDFLRDQLKRESFDLYQQVHIRAAAAQQQTIKAFQHYVAAEAWDEAIAVMREGLTEDVVNCIVTLVDLRLELFVKQLPQHLQDTNPWVLLVRGCIAIDRGLYQSGIPLIETARKIFQQNDDIDGALLADIQLLIPQLERTDNGDTYSLFCERIERYVPVITPEVRFIILLAGIWNSAWNYRHEKMEMHLLELIDELIQQDHIDSYRKFAQSIGHVLFFTSYGAKPFERVWPHMEKHAGDGKSIIRMGVCNIRSLLALFRGNLDAAADFARESQAIIRYYGGFAWAEAVVDDVLLSTMFAQGDYAAFDAYYHERIPEMTQRDTSRQYLSEFMYLYGRRLLAENRIEEANNICKELQGICNFKEFEGLFLALQAHVIRCKGELGTAEKLMLQAAAIRTDTHRYFPTHATLGLALIYWQMSEHPLAMNTLRKGLEPLASWDMPGIVVCEGREILPLLEAAIPADVFPDFTRRCVDILRDRGTVKPITIPDSGDALTPREVDILRLIVNGASNRSIADTLVITENTVKSHITRILSKLHAKSRTEAAARVRDLGIAL